MRTVPGTWVAPPSGTRVAPPSGTRVAPPSGTRVAPPSGTRVAPPSGTRVAPPSGTRVAPPSGTRVAPPSGTQVAPFSKDTHLLCYNITQCFAGLCIGKCQSQSPPVITLPLLHVPLFLSSWLCNLLSLLYSVLTASISSSHTSRVLIYQDVTGALPYTSSFLHFAWIISFFTHNGLTIFQVLWFLVPCHVLLSPHR